MWRHDNRVVYVMVRQNICISIVSMVMSQSGISMAMDCVGISIRRLNGEAAV